MKGGRLFGPIMLVLVFLALVANLVVSALTSRSLIPESSVKMLAFWALVIANLCLAGAGIYFTSKAHQKREKSSLEWSRRGFVVNAVVTLIFALAPWFFYEYKGDASEISVMKLDAMKEIAYILLLFGLSNGTFLFAFYREYVRNVGSRSSVARARHTPSLEGSERPPARRE